MTTDRVVYQATEHLKLLKEYLKCMDSIDQGLLLMKIQAGLQRLMDDAVPNIYADKNSGNAATAIEECADKLEKVHRMLRGAQNDN